MVYDCEESVRKCEYLQVGESEEKMCTETFENYTFFVYYTYLFIITFYETLIVQSLRGAYTTFCICLCRYREF